MVRRLLTKLGFMVACNNRAVAAYNVLIFGCLQFLVPLLLTTTTISPLGQLPQDSPDWFTGCLKTPRTGCLGPDALGGFDALRGV